MSTDLDRLSILARRLAECDSASALSQQELADLVDWAKPLCERLVDRSLRHGWSDEERRDAVGRAIERLHEKIGSFDDTYGRGYPALHKWVVVVVRNVIFDVARERARRNAREVPYSDPPRSKSGSQEAAHTGLMVSVPPDLNDGLAVRQQLRLAIDLLARESGNTQAVMVAISQGLSPQEVGTILQLPPGRVRQMVHRFREKLRGAREREQRGGEHGVSESLRGRGKGRR